MIHFNFIASDNFDLKEFDNVERFVDSYPDFQSVFLNNENELILLLDLLGIGNTSIHKINNLDFSKIWDLSNSKLPEFNEEQFDNFYQDWIRESKRDNNMDEYGNLIFLQGLSSKWNKMNYRLIIEEK